MNPYYYRALVQAKKCGKTDAEKLNNFKDNPQNNLDKETKQNLSRLAKFIEYAKTDAAFKYQNTFEVLNIGETSITELLKLIFDEQKIKSEFGENSSVYKIMKETCFEFLQNILEEKNIKGKIISCTCKKISNNKLDNRHNIDILLEAQTDNRQKCIFIIENKKNAELSCSEYQGRIRTQIEKYYKEIEKDIKEGDLSEYQPIFVFLCAHDFYLKYSLKTHIDNKTGYQDTITVELPDKKLIENAELDNKSEEWLLQNFGYSIKEYGNLIKILYKNLNKEYNSVFDCNGFIKSSQYSKFLFEVFEKLCSKKGNNNLKNFINYIICNEPKEITDSEIISYLDIKEKIEKDFPKIRSSKLFFYDNMKEKENVLIEILCQFIEYWELHYEMGRLLDNVKGYSKIIDGKYILDVCKELYENKVVMTNPNFPNEVRKIIKEAILYKIFDTLKIILKNSGFKNVKTNGDILFEERKFEVNLKKLYNDNLTPDDKKYIYWDNHIILFEWQNNEFYIYYDVIKDKLFIRKKKEDENICDLINANFSIKETEINENIEKFKKLHFDNILD